MATVLSATHGLLKIADAEATQTFLAHLAGLNPAPRQAQLLTQLKLLAESRIHGSTRLDVLETLRDAVLESQHARSREYWGKPVPFDKDTQEIFERSIALWHEFADAYESLIADMADAAPELAEHAEVICYRALRWVSFAMTAHNRAYYQVPGNLWAQLHRLYAFAESAGVTDVPVAEGTGGHSTVTLAYVQTVLAQRAQPDALSVLQMNTVDRALAQWVGLVRLLPEAPTAAGDSLLAVDLESTEGARRVKNLPGNNLRYLDLDAFGDKLRQTAVALKTQSPDRLGLGHIARESCEKLMQTLHIHWLAPGTGRVDERKPMSFTVLVSGTIAAMHFNISGKPFAPPDSGLSSRARYEMAGFQRVDGPVGEASSRSRTLETWTVTNQSASGILGMCNTASVTTQLAHNQLLGLVAPNGNAYLGQVQRISVDVDGIAWLGLRLLKAKVEAVAARVSTIDQPYDRALLIRESVGNEVQSIIVSPGTYGPSRILDLHDGQLRQIRLTALIDCGANFERATYTAA